MSKKISKKTNAETSVIISYEYLRVTLLFGLCLLLLATPFFRGLFFAPEQQKALLYAIVLFWITWLWKWLKGEGGFLKTAFDYLVLALPVVYIISFFNAANKGLAIDEIVKTFLYFLVYWCVANLVTGEKDAVRVLNLSA